MPAFHRVRPVGVDGAESRAAVVVERGRDDYIGITQVESGELLDNRRGVN
jgi:hypothetical protein